MAVIKRAGSNTLGSTWKYCGIAGGDVSAGCCGERFGSLAMWQKVEQLACGSAILFLGIHLRTEHVQKMP